MICVFPGSHILRTSKHTPPVSLTVCDVACVSAKTTANVDMSASLATAFRATVNRWGLAGELFEEPSVELDGLSSDTCQFLELLANSFTYEEQPRFVQQLLDHIGRVTHTDLEDDLTNPLTWAEAFEDKCYNIEELFPNWDSTITATSEFARLLSMILEQYVQKCNPGYGFNYTMSLHRRSNVGIHHCIGKPVDWSHGLVIPYLKWYEEEL